jgi:hypothetical protein
MKLRSFLFVSSVIAATGLAGGVLPGCELIASVDRNLIPDGQGGGSHLDFLRWW